jgi:hypothetical protein
MHRLVWQFREDTADVFPVPPQHDALRFAVTEACGEALDAHLRENPTYKRNRDKDHSEHRELAQALFMLYTAYGPRPFYGEWWPDTNIDIDDVCFATVMALKYGGEEIKVAIRIIRQYVGDGIEDELIQALDALRVKHGVTPVTEVA